MVILIYKMTEIVRAVIGQRTYGLLYRLTPFTTCNYFIKAIERIFYGFPAVINSRGM